MDPLANFAIGLMANSPSKEGVTFQLQTGHGVRFPTLVGGEGFNCPIHGVGELPPYPNAEIVRVTAHAAASDTFTVVRKQEGTIARDVKAGDVIYLGPTKFTLEQIAQEAVESRPEETLATGLHEFDVARYNLFNFIINGNVTLQPFNSGPVPKNAIMKLKLAGNFVVQWGTNIGWLPSAPVFEPLSGVRGWVAFEVPPGGAEVTGYGVPRGSRGERGEEGPEGKAGPAGTEQPKRNVRTWAVAGLLKNETLPGYFVDLIPPQIGTIVKVQFKTQTGKCTVKLRQNGSVITESPVTGGHGTTVLAVEVKSEDYIDAVIEGATVESSSGLSYTVSQETEQ